MCVCVGTPETLWRHTGCGTLCQTTWCNNPEYNHLHTRRRENLKFNQASLNLARASCHWSPPHLDTCQLSSTTIPTWRARELVRCNYSVCTVVRSQTLEKCTTFIKEMEHDSVAKVRKGVMCQCNMRFEIREVTSTVLPVLPVLPVLLEPTTSDMEPNLYHASGDFFNTCF
jgi:hypothetical protein